MMELARRHATPFKGKPAQLNGVTGQWTYDSDFKQKAVSRVSLAVNLVCTLGTVTRAQRPGP
jgi:hypothetical protein